MMQKQLENQKDLNVFNQELALQYWDKTNLSAQMEQAKKAGLSPGLLYKQGGAGGSTLSQGGSAAAAGSAQFPSAVKEGLMMGLAARQQQADIELTEATKEKTEAEKEKIEGVETDKGRAEIENLIANTADSRVHISPFGTSCRAVTIPSTPICFSIDKVILSFLPNHLHVFSIFYFLDLFVSVLQR